MDPANQICVEDNDHANTGSTTSSSLEPIDRLLPSDSSAASSSSRIDNSGGLRDFEDVGVLEAKLQSLTRQLSEAVELRNASEHACDKLDSQVGRTRLLISHPLNLPLYHLICLLITLSPSLSLSLPLDHSISLLITLSLINSLVHS